MYDTTNYNIAYDVIEYDYANDMIIRGFEREQCGCEVHQGAV